jgi:hypothetical protein
LVTWSISTNHSITLPAKLVNVIEQVTHPPIHLTG